MEYIISSKLGGQPVKFDDFDFAAKEQLTHLSKALLGFTDHENKVVVLNGCSVDIDGSDLEMTAGYVFFEGEIFEVDAVSIEATVGDVAVWQLVETYDTRGNKRFKDETVQDTYLVRKYTVVYKPSGSVLPTEKLLDGGTDYYNSYLGSPIGAVIMWFGSEASVPGGYSICDGRSENGFTTPNLFDRLLVGDDAVEEVGNTSEGGTSAPNFYGSWSFTLSSSNIPSHNHGTGTLVVSTTTVDLTIDYDTNSYDEKSGTTRNFYGQGASFNDGPGSSGINQLGHNHVISGSTANYGSGAEKIHRPKHARVMFIMRTA